MEGFEAKGSKGPFQGECNGCGHATEVATFFLEDSREGAVLERDSDPKHVPEIIEVELCQGCAKTCNVEGVGPWAKESVVMEWKPLPADWGRFGASGETFIDELEHDDSVFVKKLSSFLAGEVRLEDGTEHPLLASVAKQVTEDLKKPTGKQVGAFKGIYDALMEKKRSGEPLRIETPEDKDKRKQASEKLLELAERGIGLWRRRGQSKTIDIVLSMKKQYLRKGNLSVPQVKYLRWIVENLPPELLEG